MLNNFTEYNNYYFIVTGNRLLVNMTKSQVEIVQIFFNHLVQSNYDKAKDFMVPIEFYKLYNKYFKIGILFFRRNSVQCFWAIFGPSH